MNDFYLANAASINLNFVIYIQNLYENYNKSHETIDKFPWLPLNKEGLLNVSDFQIRAKQVWSMIFNSDNLYEYDIDYWSNNKFSFDKLFKDTSIGVELYKIVKRSFRSWYWETGYRMCTIFFSDCLVEDYYNKLINLSKIKNSEFKTNKFYLQVVYDIPPNEWSLKNENMIIISPQIQLPTAEEFDVI
ncbi:hypothetical protein B9W14_16000 [Clostridium drakei]|uniref:Uncharacterized protein n=1 Tax=Clostridium drakei TaxID=332101 RepID=A0A2U8DYZ4_9CLOT|nr:hypothetical protein B9W14_16000 [Clostridium drakei]